MKPLPIDGAWVPGAASAPDVDPSDIEGEASRHGPREQGAAAEEFHTMLKTACTQA
jgi:hypothetical protein